MLTAADVVMMDIVLEENKQRNQTVDRMRATKSRNRNSIQKQAETLDPIETTEPEVRPTEEKDSDVCHCS